MEKLIGMTDFVLEQRKTYNGDFEYLADLYYRYAKFLKQPLELWMFVPCDKYDNVVEFDKKEEKYTKYHIEKYKQAKERCLFEGFRVENGIVFTPENQVIIQKSLLEKITIEHLIGLNHSLTETAIKQLGL